VTIKFVCTCGKHLRARDEMAARRSMCPNCGAPVGIPSRRPIHPGGAAPMTPLERQRHARNQPPSEPATAQTESPTPAEPQPVDTRLVRLLSRRGNRRDLTGRHLEKHWGGCLLYPFRAWRLCLGLAVFLTVFSAGLAVFLPHMLAKPPDDPTALAASRVSCVLLLLLLVGPPGVFLVCVLASAVDGEVYSIRWSGNPLITLLVSGARWLSCFLAGPVVFAGTAYLYWMSCGDPVLLDWLILAELGIVGIAYQIFALLAVTDRGRLRDVNPVAVADLIHRLGWRALVVVLAAAGLLLAHGALLIAGVTEVHKGALTGWVMLASGWLSGVFWSTFFCRLLGVWCHRSWQAQDQP
jgi:hypothetical protein